MREVSSESSSGSEGSFDEDEGEGSFDFLASISAPSASSSSLVAGSGSGSGSQLGSPTPAGQRSPLYRGSHLVPARSVESDGTTSTLLEHSASDEAEAFRQEATPDELEEQFRDVLKRNLGKHTSALAAAAEDACRSMHARVAERLSAMLNDGMLPEPAAALVEQ
eukprot:COSAG02_NODE_31450_length_533_cov_0.949309_1_plen_164_part_01